MDIGHKRFIRKKYEDESHNTAIIAIDDDTNEETIISTNLSHCGIYLSEDSFVVDQTILDNNEDFIRAFALAFCDMSKIKAIRVGSYDTIILTLNDINEIEMIA